MSKSDNVLDPVKRAKLLEEMRTPPEGVLYAIKWVIQLKKIKVSVGDALLVGEFQKVRIEPAEKLVRIRAALLTLPPEILEVIEAEAKNRVDVMITQAIILDKPPRDPWE
jgi:hypothetical protein